MIPIAKPFIGDAEKSAVMDVMDSGMLAQGPRTAQLEERFAELCRVKHAIGTTSGTTALHLALLANGVGPGDEVITTPFSFIASTTSILFTGARPVFVDIEEETFNLDPSLVEAAISPRTRAILPVDLYGHPCDMEALQAIAGRHGLKIIEDACQAVGARFKDKMAGSLGTGAFSLYATKNVMSGEGGIITTDDDEIAERCRLLRSHGMKRRYHHDMLGYNFRMSDLHAAIGLAQMDRLPEFDRKRRENAAYFSQNLRSVVTPNEKPGYKHVYHQYTVRLEGGSGEERDAAVKQLNEAGVGTAVFYPVPIHEHDFVREIVGRPDLPVTERMTNEVFCLPVHPQLSQEDLDKIVVEVNRL